MGVSTIAGPTGIPRASARDPLILVLDVGTSSVRAALYDATGEPISGIGVQVQHEMTVTPEGGVETDAGELLDRVCRCIDGALAQAGPLSGRIAAIAPSVFWHNLIGVRADGTPITPVLTWADTRSEPAAEALRRELDPEAVHARTGCVIHPSYLPAKIRHLQTEQADQLVDLRYWLSFAEFLTLRLFGSPTCSISIASASGLLDQHRCVWDAEMLRTIPVDSSRLSPLDDTPRRGLLPAYAQRWPALRDVPWFPGWGDGAASNVGAGAFGRQRAALMVGTSGALRVAWEADDVAIPSRLWCYRIDRHRVVMGGALSNGGNLIEWMRETLRLPDDLAQIDAAIAALQPDAHGLTVLPFLAGERSTGWVADARAAINGMQLHTSPVEIMRAAHEAVAYRFKLVWDLVRVAIPEVDTVLASGGALLHSPVWTQMMADVLETPISASAVLEASSRGAALLALLALGSIPALDAAPIPTGAIYVPDPTHRAAYRAGFARQQALYARLVSGK